MLDWIFDNAPQSGFHAGHPSSSEISSGINLPLDPEFLEFPEIPEMSEILDGEFGDFSRGFFVVFGCASGSVVSCSLSWIQNITSKILAQIQNFDSAKSLIRFRHRRTTILLRVPHRVPPHITASYHCPKRWNLIKLNRSWKYTTVLSDLVALRLSSRFVNRNTLIELFEKASRFT